MSRSALSLQLRTLSRAFLSEHPPPRDLAARQLEQRAETIYDAEHREIFDTHDYSSAAYSGYDDGHNSGVDRGMELLIEHLLAESTIRRVGDQLLLTFSIRSTTQGA